MEYNVKTEAFEGPLDLLLHLINRLEVDIYDIPMSQITEQYLHFVHAMQEFELDVASEYLVMAATLLAIKSKMLLPKHEEELEEDVEMLEEDPRDELVEKLIEYRKYKEAAQELKQKEEERVLMYTKPPSDLSQFTKRDMEQSLQTLDVNIYDMLGAFHKLLRRKKLQKPLSTRITRQEIPIERRMDEVKDQLAKMGRTSSFIQLFEYETRDQLVVTFLAILELMKRNEIQVIQESNFTDIELRLV
ncbi:segregation and condensation protein A [Bacillus coahuilensis p1.1.43]|uniref:Segregation and condensation protein A n=1 Tax=Bacillus coahuilensis p1.1.43 TaxID=1150625 RepID=A0A147K7X9_9BACI|nr:segregation/condensation protein A [Bacillus coahuilensis]KUP06254.1 segregation and condensation protein A [Bacillus coahuilensis p1.1.43]